ncbi:uncharacterized protein NECHADRAFT_51178 [Fusarium vanettenii 77-13-4]|uniref:D-isomer specific 2-hydroxyacid dehydrogenase NAD-binding domain-containing protein n=1 Tax=Fusarium vanettenii (strain ATCC MYA-4622 / CBS 123669 / FGSC 9596 / NRRL 45880 / 77-13-4) TaxID=660122 RepID=C7ZKP9_FUSV7|nr:uncharacterized protein NECHADRAFT_51178 [Fusarium vanettenii 77-13-4]EEU35440.1 hypothetical protein NECHADRAFT_51178 [Fusarium vanettenii 77-13-4]
MPLFNPQLALSHRHTGYSSTTPDEIAQRLRDATMAIITMMPISVQDLDQCPSLKCILATSTGVDWIDRDAFLKRGIRVLNTPHTNIAAFAEHAIALYFAVRRRIIELHGVMTTTKEYYERRTLKHRFPELPLSCSQETLGVFGYGHLGKCIESIATALGMRVLIAERKGQPPRDGRVAFEDVLREATVLVIAAPKNRDTVDMISEGELKTMRRDAILINVARGGIANEEALVKCLRSGWIGAAAVDVYDGEPPQRGVSPLLEDNIPNLILSPHLAWLSAQIISNRQDGIVKELVAYVAGESANVIL